jgi:hypothetical protein
MTLRNGARWVAKNLSAFHAWIDANVSIALRVRSMREEPLVYNAADASRQSSRRARTGCECYRRRHSPGFGFLGSHDGW